MAAAADPRMGQTVRRKDHFMCELRHSLFVRRQIAKESNVIVWKETLTEMAAYTIKQLAGTFANWLEREMENYQRNHTKEPHNSVNKEALQEVFDFLEKHEHSVTLPFGIVNDEGTILAPNGKYLNYLQRAYPERTIIIAIDDEILEWANKLVDAADLRLHKPILNVRNPTESIAGKGIIAKAFLSFYKNLPML
jgi:hypothetical protein